MAERARHLLSAVSGGLTKCDRQVKFLGSNQTKAKALRNRKRVWLQGLSVMNRLYGLLLSKTGNAAMNPFARDAKWKEQEVRKAEQRIYPWKRCDICSGVGSLL